MISKAKLFLGPIPHPLYITFCYKDAHYNYSLQYLINYVPLIFERIGQRRKFGEAFYDFLMLHTL